MNYRKWINNYSTDLQLKYAPSTVSAYLHAVGKFLFFFDKYREPKEIPNQKIKEYLLTFNTHNTRKQMHCAVARFYEMTVHSLKRLAVYLTRVNHLLYLK